MINAPFAPEMAARAPGPLLEVRTAPDGKPLAVRAVMSIAAPPARVWAVITDLKRYPERVPMIDKVRIEGDRATVQLKFRVSLFSAGFEFTARIAREEGRSFDLSYVSGEPAGIHLRFDLVPHPDGVSTLVYNTISFDIQSLGWLVKFFLKNHPEIQFGVFTGTSVTLLDAIRRAAEGSD